MLTVKIHTGEDGSLLSLAGHAGAGKLIKAPVIRLHLGDARIEIFDGGQAGEQLFDTLQTGFALLAAKYPEYVKLETI